MQKNGQLCTECFKIFQLHKVCFDFESADQNNKFGRKKPAANNLKPFFETLSTVALVPSVQFAGSQRKPAAIHSGCQSIQ
jgi:hypothetical protein